MSFMKIRHLQQNTELGSKNQIRESGSITLVTGLFVVLFIAILLCIQLQFWVFQLQNMYLEDALAASGLASAIIDIEEYGISKKVIINDYEQAYATFCDAVKDNLNLDENFYCRNSFLIDGQVKVEKYIVYNIEEGSDENIVAPNGKRVTNTGIYSEISFPVRGPFGFRTTAHKGKLVDVVARVNEEELD